MAAPLYLVEIWMSGRSHLLASFKDRSRAAELLSSLLADPDVRAQIAVVG